MVHVVILVLGDLGRSPRMQYHAKSLSELEGITKVTEIGYYGEEALFKETEKVNEVRFKPLEFTVLKRVAILHAAMKGLGLVLGVLKTLSRISEYDILIIQNPPGLPAVLAASLLSLKNGSTVMMDWHNLGYAMFEQKLGSRHPLVGIARLLEYLTGSLLVDESLCVSNAMRDWLKRKFFVDATTLYDRPANLFSKERPSLQARHELLNSLGFTDRKLFSTMQQQQQSLSLDNDSGNDDRRMTIQTTTTTTTTTTTATTTRPTAVSSTQSKPQSQSVALRADRARLVISSTSWTDDEDFDLLLNALLLLDDLLKKIETESGTTTRTSSTTSTTSTSSVLKMAKTMADRVVVVITGKGALRSLFEDEVKKHESAGRLTRVAVRTAWLSSSDYPLLLGCADLGVCLHSSTSGLDLPMKVLDMFGSGLPVCALDFPTIPELVKHNHNGLIFKTSEELANQIMRLLFPTTAATTTTSDAAAVAASADKEGFPNSELDTLRKGAQEMGTWDENWNRVAGPKIKRIIEKREKSVLCVITAARKVFLFLICLFVAIIYGVAVLYLGRPTRLH